MLLTCFLTWVIVTRVTWVTLGRLTYMALRADLGFYLGHRWLMAGRQDVGLFLFRHTSDLNVVVAHCE